MTIYNGFLVLTAARPGMASAEHVVHCEAPRHRLDPRMDVLSPRHNMLANYYYFRRAAHITLGMIRMLLTWTSAKY